MKQGWEVRKLGDVCKKITDGSHNPPKGIDSSEFMMISSKNIFDDLIHFEDPRYLTQKDFENENKRTEVQFDDVLLTVVGTIGRVAVVPQFHPKFTLQRSVAVFKIDKEILESRFLMFSLQNILQFLTDEARGVAQKGIYLNQLKEIEIPLPPLPEQQRIVAILDEAFAAIAQAKANAEQNLKNAKELFESYLQSVFENKGEGWELCNLETYIKLIDYRGRTPVKTENGVRLITAKNVKLGYLQLEPQEFIAENNYENWMTRGIPNFGDVIFTTEAPLANVAQIDSNDKVAFAQRIIVMQPEPSKLNQTFLKYMLLSNPIRNKILGKGTGATVLGIKSSLLKKIEIYFPNTIIEQQAIVQRLDALSAETKQLETIYQQKINDLDELKKSILQKAFAGELNTTTLEV